MKNLLLGLGLFFLTLNHLKADSTVEERLAKLEDRVEEINIDRSLDRFNFSGTFITNVENINSTKTDIETNEKDVTTGNLAGMHIGLNIDFKISPKLDLFTTLAMGKIYNNDGRSGISEQSYRSFQGSYGYTGSDARFDVAYLRWKTFEDKLTFALGRMTTSGGPPLNQLDALYRNGTYPRFSYNAILDGAAVIYDFKSLLPKDMGFKTRIFYTPTFFVDTSDRTAQQTDPDGEKVKTRSDQVAWLNEWDLNHSKLAKRVSVYSMLWYYDDFYDAGYQSSTRAGPEYYQALSHTLYLGFEKILNTGLNFSWSYLRVSDYLDGTGDSQSDASLFNFNYVFEKGLVIGMEYIATDKNFYLDEWAYLQFNEFYQRSNNSGQHYFLTFPLKDNQVLRFGVFDYHAGAAPENLYFYKERTRNFYTSYRIDF